MTVTQQSIDRARRAWMAAADEVSRDQFETYDADTQAELLQRLEQAEAFYKSLLILACIT